MKGLFFYSVKCFFFFLGSNILSAGEEGVLVQWQYKTHHQQFLPRLGAPIHHIAVSSDDSLAAISQKDNGKLLFIQALLSQAALSKCAGSWQFCCLQSVSCRLLHIGLHWEPSSKEGDLAFTAYYSFYGAYCYKTF